MQTRRPHITDASTVSALAERLRGSTLRTLSVELGEPVFSIATLSEVMRHIPGALSVEGERELRRRLNLNKLRARRRYHRPCMDDATYAAWLAWRAEQC